MVACRAKDRTTETGYVLVATAIGVVALLSAVGLAIDLGRMYVAKAEAQNFADAAALAACVRLDGTAFGLERARAVVTESPNRWNFGTRPFSQVLIEFGRTATGPWESEPATAVGYRFVRVTVQADVPLSLIRLLVRNDTGAVRAQAVAGQTPLPRVSQGSCPFSPLAHNAVPPHFGLIPGQLYTLRWAANPKLNNPDTVCPGDARPEIVQLAMADGHSERGYIEDTSASAIREAILYNAQTYTRGIGDSVVPTGGVKQTIRDALRQRVSMDTDPYSPNFATYIAKIRNRSASRGNGVRLIVCPINTGPPAYRVVQFATFFLLPAEEYRQGASFPFCAEYVGAAYVQGSETPGAGEPGFYVVRLVQ